jgi:hypothetical protein
MSVHHEDRVERVRLIALMCEHDAASRALEGTADGGGSMRPNAHTYSFLSVSALRQAWRNRNLPAANDEA